MLLHKKTKTGPSKCITCGTLLDITDPLPNVILTDIKLSLQTFKALPFHFQPFGCLNTYQNTIKLI